jgi:hypothetical protein
MWWHYCSDWHASAESDMSIKKICREFKCLNQSWKFSLETSSKSRDRIYFKPSIENGNLPDISNDSRVSIMKYATSEHIIVKCTVGLLLHRYVYNALLCPVGKHTVTLSMS